MTKGIDEPDGRGRTGLHLTGLGLDRNPDVAVKSVELLANDWYVLRATTFDSRKSDGLLAHRTPGDLRPRQRCDDPALRPASAARCC